MGVKLGERRGMGEVVWPRSDLGSSASPTLGRHLPALMRKDSTPAADPSIGPSCWLWDSQTGGSVGRHGVLEWEESRRAWGSLP